MDSEECQNCDTTDPASIAWGKYLNSEGRPKFWRLFLCASCKKITGAK
jgi:hypothetical protein